MKPQTKVMMKELEMYQAAKISLQDAKKNLEALEYQLENVRAVSWNKIGRKESLTDNSQITLALIEKKTNLEKKYQMYSLIVQDVNSFMIRLDEHDRQLIMDKYANSIPYYEMADKYNLTERAMRTEIKNIIEANI